MSCQHVEATGWSMWFSEYVFSKRSCAQDARELKSDLNDLPQPFWLSVVLERTGFTRGDLLAVQRLPVPSKDLVYPVRCAHSVVPAIYVITVAIPKTSPLPTLESVIKEGPSVVVISLIALGALKFNFVCCSTLLVLSAALFTGRMLTLFGCGVLSLLQCFMEAAIANIIWSEHLKPICGWLINILGDLL